MIDWFNVLYNFLWILGLALLLTVFSLAHWLAEQQKKSLRQNLAEPPYRLAIAAGFMQFALGLTLLMEPWWYKIGWIGVMALSFWEAITAWKEWAANTKRG